MLWRLQRQEDTAAIFRIKVEEESRRRGSFWMKGQEERLLTNQTIEIMMKTVTTDFLKVKNRIRTNRKH